ncbi:uncharacterized protein LOC107619895 [Arachis ipaensis]|uniref:uncharacterized protein LOC107619895 n=1 Tax=Arachis ipaensis TaxID=130454 RepID=UPI0007AFC639|nr:uncharacterized protein LOC107619895 [Arachis ipaensis]
MCKGRAEVDRKAQCPIQVPRCVGRKGSPILQLDEKRDSVLMDPSVRGSLQSLQEHNLSTTLTEEASTTVLVREEGKIQQPVNFVSKALQGVELKYSMLENLAYALLTFSRRLRQYFQGHQIIVRTDQAIWQVLQKPDLAGMRMTWAIELSQYDLQYEPIHAIKAQAMADFLVEYEALLGGLLLAREVGATRVEICSDSQVVTSQINGTYQARDSLLQKYLEKFKKVSEEFDEVTVQHVPRERNTRADLLSKLASTKPGTGNRSLIQGLVKEPSVTLHITRADDFPLWIDPITDFLEEDKLPNDEKAAKALRREAAKFTIIQGQLFKKGLNQPLLKCLRPDQMDYVLSEVHEGCYGHHIGGKALARKLIKTGYYWPSMMADSKEFVKRCRRCQESANFHKGSAAELSLLMASRPFS